MQIATKQKDMEKNRRELTHQHPFPSTVQCGDCAEMTHLMMIIFEDDGHALVNERPKKVKIWPHDSVAIALYLCTHCGYMMAEWNQA